MSNPHISCYNMHIGDLIIMAEEERSIQSHLSSAKKSAKSKQSGSREKDKDKQRERKDKSLLGDKGYVQFEADEDPFPTDLGSFRSRADPHGQRDRCSPHFIFIICCLPLLFACTSTWGFLFGKPGPPKQANSESHLSRLERALQISPKRYRAIFIMHSYCLFSFLFIFLVFLYPFAFPMLGIFISQLSPAEVINIRSIVRDPMILSNAAQHQTNSLLMQSNLIHVFICRRQQLHPNENQYQTDAITICRLNALRFGSE